MRKYVISTMAFVAIIATAWFPIRLNSPPAALTATAPDTLFSAARAFEHVLQIARSPHSIGTKEHDLVRDYISQQCNLLGLQTEIQRTTTIRTFGEYVLAGNIQNIVARLRGTESTKVVLLMAHYDSQPNTPGAGDDGAGVAALLETVRMLKACKPLKNDVVFLFTDGEENGLLGAQAYVDELENPERIGLVINLEGRGNTGISTMFETNYENGWIIKEYAKGAPYPMANSLSYEIYKRLTNDTDYTIFKRAGIPGLNHALIEGYVNYHSMTDKPESLNLNSLQHHGANIAGLALHLGNIDLSNNKAPDISYFNILGSWLVHYPGSWNMAFVIVGILMTVSITVLSLLKKRASIKGILAGFFGFPILVSISFFAIKYFLNALLWCYPLYTNFYSGNSYNSYYYFFAITAFGSVIIAQPLMWASKKFNTTSIMTGVLVIATVLLIVWYKFASTATYIIFIPLLFAWMAQLIALLRKIEESDVKHYSLLISLGSLPTILLLSPTIYFMFVAFGLGKQTPIIMVILGFMIAMVLPVLVAAFRSQRYWITILALVSCLGAVIGGHINSQYSDKRPLQSQLRYVMNADSNSAQWITKKIDPGNRSFFTGAKIDQDINFVSNAPVLDLPSPVLTVVKDTIVNGFRRLKLHCSNPRNGSLLSFRFSVKDKVQLIVLDSLELRTEGSFSVMDFYGPGQDGIYFAIESKERGFECWVKDLTVGLNQIAGNHSLSPGSIPSPGYNSNTIKIGRYFTF